MKKKLLTVFFVNVILFTIFSACSSPVKEGKKTAEKVAREICDCERTKENAIQKVIKKEQSELENHSFQTRAEVQVKKKEIQHKINELNVQYDKCYQSTQEVYKKTLEKYVTNKKKKSEFENAYNNCFYGYRDACKVVISDVSSLFHQIEKIRLSIIPPIPDTERIKLDLIERNIKSQRYVSSLIVEKAIKDIQIVNENKQIDEYTAEIQLILQSAENEENKYESLINLNYVLHQNDDWIITSFTIVDVFRVSNENDLRMAIGQAGNKHAIIVMTNNIEIISNLSIPSESELILKSANEKMYSLIAMRNMDVLTIQENAKLTIENIKITRKSGTSGSGIIVKKNSTFTLDEGLITGNNISSGLTGGGVTNTGTFIMNGGSITGNSGRGTRSSGGVASFSTFIMNGGTIRDDIHYEQTFVMNDGIINGRVANNSFWEDTFNMNGGTITGDVLSKSITINNGTIRGNVTQKGRAKNMEYIMKGGIIYGNLTIDVGIMHNGIINGRVINNSGNFIMHNGTISGSSGVGVNNGGGWGGASFTMNGGIISGHKDGGVLNGGTVGVSTFIMNGGIICGNKGNGVTNSRSNTFNMNGGTITGNGISDNGGGVNTVGKFTMKGGMIHKNKAKDNGGGVNQSGGTFIFDGGWIFNNSAKNGNDIQIGQAGTFNNNVYDVNVGAIGSRPPASIYVEEGCAKSE